MERESLFCSIYDYLGWSFFLCTVLFLISVCGFIARYAARGADMTGYLVDFFSNIMPIRLFSSEVSERHILHKSFDRVQRAEKRLSAHVRMWFFFDFSFCGLQALNFTFCVMASASLG